MRVLIANKLAWPAGGADRYSLDLARALRDRGHEIRMLSTADHSNEETSGAFVGATITRETRDRVPPREAAAIALRALWNRSAAAATERLLDDFAPDVVHAHKLYPQLSAAPVRVAALRGVPVVQTLHDYELMSASALDDGGGSVDRRESRGRYRALNTALHPLRTRLHARAVAAFTAPSRHVAEAHGVDAEVVPPFAPPALREPPAFDARRGVAFAGRLTPEKGVADTLGLGRYMDVTVAGAGPLEADVRAGPVGYAGRLTRAGVLELFASARVVVVPSRWPEPAGLVALEAMAVGTPVVAYRAGGLAELVEAAGGLLTDPAGLAAACARLAEDREEWERRSRSELGAVATTFSEDRHIGRVERVYERVAA
jgi:glycosyltransferase involved in cell wall biosynthesis